MNFTCKLMNNVHLWKIYFPVNCKFWIIHVNLSPQRWYMITLHYYYYSLLAIDLILQGDTSQKFNSIQFIMLTYLNEETFGLIFQGDTSQLRRTTAWRTSLWSEWGSTTRSVLPWSSVMATTSPPRDFATSSGPARTPSRYGEGLIVACNKAGWPTSYRRFLVFLCEYLNQRPNCFSSNSENIKLRTLNFYHYFL